MEPAELAADDIRAAAQRLRGQVVQTPLIGDLMLRAVRSDHSKTDLYRCARLKAECLQTGGSIEFRGALHFLLRQMGSLKGLVVPGPKELVLSRVLAGHTQRLPMLVEGPTGVWRRDLIHSHGGELVDNQLPPEQNPFPPPLAEPVPLPWEELLAARRLYRARQLEQLAKLAQERGYRLLPHVEDEAYACGVATVGLELASELPSDMKRVYVSPPELAAAIEAGLRAEGHPARVVGVDLDAVLDATKGTIQTQPGWERAVPIQPAGVALSVAEVAKIRCEELGAAALSQALLDNAGEESCVVLSC